MIALFLMVFFLSFYRVERHTEVFMDIVDTFNHLIPTEHLDDALFLGSNLENEVCEDFSTSQNVLEDSLKNMLSDKDPMLGSASNQFCLPVLDSNDPNFQMPCSTGNSSFFLSLQFKLKTFQQHLFFLFFFKHEHSECRVLFFTFRVSSRHQN